MINLLRRNLGVIYSILIVLFLLAPLIQWRTHLIREKTLYGYTDPVPNKPIHYRSAFFDKSLQQWIEKFFNTHLGFRAYFIRSYNELNFRLFHEVNNTRLKLTTTPHHGLYSNLSIDSLNQEMIQKETLENRYTLEANKLLKIQHDLASKNKFFIVVLASSKAYIYPKELGKRYLVHGAHHVFKRTANFGRILKATGVNVIDAGPLLRHLTRTSHIETHPISGLHWNYYAACIIAQHIIENSSQQFSNMSKLDCGHSEPRLPPGYDVDVDGYSLLNIWSSAKLLRPTPYPSHLISIDKHSPWHPKIVLIGDSFSDQIQFILNQIKMPEKLVVSSYFKTRTVIPSLQIKNNKENPVQQSILKDIEKSDIIILEMVDYNVTSWLTYGFADYFLKHASL
ncbi:MAG: hypothetical protein NTW08_00570 [Gammaproteobacteria bacterium]|nr:hypothetical protein [Gammaproteobacteria bacterium]